MSSKVCPSFVACVVGLSLEHGEAFGRRPGVGKSCLCYRFTYPGFDDYISSHKSLYALHEFESRAINNDHFLYWGSPVKSFSTTDSARVMNVRVHVLEHTVFYQDVTCQPFNITMKPDKPECYVKKIVGAIESPGKLSYRSRDEVSTPEEYNAVNYPTGISKSCRGFLVVIDVSIKGDPFEKQLKRAEKVLEHLTKHKRKHVIAATKRDAACTPSLEKVYDLKKKYHTHVVEVSAEENLNVDECFRVLAYKLLKTSVKLSSQVKTYPEAAHVSLAQKGSTKRFFCAYLKKRIRDPDDRVDTIAQNMEYKECVSILGKYEADKLFASHVLEVFNEKVDLFAGVKENPDMREEFLEDFLEQRSDLSMYNRELREWIAAKIRELSSMTSLEESDQLDEDQYDIPQPVAAPLDDYQLFQRTPPSPPSRPHPTQSSVFSEDGATLSSCEPDDVSRDNDSYYSDSDGSEGPDYVNYDPKQLPLLGDNKSNDYIDETQMEHIHSNQVVSSSVNASPPLEKTPPIKSHPTIDPPSSPSNIKGRAKALANLLGHKSQEEEETPLIGVTSHRPPEQRSPTPPTPPHRESSKSSDPSRPKQGEWASPPTPEPVHKPTSPQKSIRNRAQLLSGLLGHKPAPPPTAPRPKPSQSPGVTKRNVPQPPSKSTNLPSKNPLGASTPNKEGTDSTDGRGMRRVRSVEESDTGRNKEIKNPPPKTPPPVGRRVSSLPRKGSTSQFTPPDSDDSAPSTPRSGRKPVRVAPPPPPKQESLESTSPSLNRSAALSPSPPPDSKTKPRLEAIRQKVQKRKDYEHQTLKERKDYEHRTLKESSTSQTKKPESKPAPPSQPEPAVVRPYLTSIDIDEMVKEREMPPPPLPPRLIPHPEEPQDTEEPPMLPPRTEAMFVIEEEEKPKKEVKGSRFRARDYTNVAKDTEAATDKKSGSKGNSRERSIVSPIRMLLKNKGRNQSLSSEPVSSPKSRMSPPTRELPAIPVGSGAPTPPKSQFLVMSSRPLPAEPFANTGEDDDGIDEGHEYEIFDFDKNGRPMLPASEAAARGLVREQRPLPSSTSHSPSLEAKKMLLPHSPSRGPPPTRAASVQRSKTFNGNDTAHPPPLATRAKVPKGVWPEYVDGYVNTEPPPADHDHVPPSPSASLQGRQLPLTPFERTAQQLPSGRDVPDYDYPDLRSFVTLPKKKAQIPVPPRFPSQNKGAVGIDDPDYIDMNTQYQQGDESYVNAESIEHIREQLLGLGVAPTTVDGQQFSQDDMSVYMNLPAPPSVTMSLPPRGIVLAAPSEPTSHVVSQAKAPPPVQPRRDRTVTTSGATPTLFTAELQSRISQRPDLPVSQSLDEASAFGDDQDYMNVSASLPASLLESKIRGNSPRVPKRMQGKKEPVNAPIINLPPRNIKRTLNE